MKEPSGGRKASNLRAEEEYENLNYRLAAKESCFANCSIGSPGAGVLGRNCELAIVHSTVVAFALSGVAT